MKRWRLPSLLAALVVALGAAASLGYSPPHSRPGPATDTLYFRSFNVDRAPLDLQAGDMDLYFFNLKTAAARQLQNSPDVRLYQAPASTISLILNPAPGPAGQLNPFSLPPVRRAVQHLIDREFIANEIYQGMALPMTTHVSPVDYDYLTVYDLVRESDIRFDPEFARSLVDKAMTEAGAEKKDGVWNYKGSPIRLKFIIRVEDERREVGDAIRAQLEKMGFAVDPAYQSFGPAIFTVYSSDPNLLQWHLYTEGWGRSSPERYDFATVNQMAAPWLGNMPGWQEVGFWQYEDPEMDALGKKIFTGAFQSQKERDQLYQEVTRRATEASVRLWIATVMNNFPASKKMDGVTEDLVAGPKGPWTLREAFIPGKKEMTIGHLWVWTDRTTWNPIGGFGDVYSNDIWRAMSDPPLWNHPVTGVPIPFRATFETTTAGPSGKLDVPQDAVVWDAVGDRWKSVGSGVKATSKVIYDYAKFFQSKWHDGQPITMADVAYSLAQGFERTYDPDKAQIEFALATTSRPYLDTFRGFRVLDANRLEVYVDFWHFQTEFIAGYASPSGLAMPWEMLAAMDELVYTKRRAAYTDTAAQRFSVPWLSLVIKQDAILVRNVLREFAAQSFLPEQALTMGGKLLADKTQAQARYQAAIDWYEKQGHLVIANGPYKLTRYDPPAQFAELQAYRDPTYPFKPGDWHFGAPELVEISSVGSVSVSPGKPASIGVGLKGPGKLGLQYQLFDPATGKIVASGAATRRSDTDHAIELESGVTSRLQTGLYQLYLLAYSDVTARTTERKIDVPVGQETPTAGTPTGQVPPTPAPSTPGCRFPPAQESAPVEGAYLIGAVGVAALIIRRRR